MPLNNSEETFKKIPHSMEAERAVLGACLMDTIAAGNVLEKLKPGDFFAPQHQLIFACVDSLLDEGNPCDPITVGETLRQAGDLERCGGLAYLSGLLDAVPAASAASYYAKIVSDKAQIRNLMQSLEGVLLNVQEGGYGATELVDIAEKAVFDVSQRRRSSDLAPLRDLLSPVFVQMSNIKAAGGVTGVPTFSDLDVQYLSGLQAGDLIILAARPGCGKTSMAVNIAQNAAAKHGKVVAIFSLEMPKEQLVQRMLCTQAEVDHSRVRKGLASKTDIKRLSRAVTELSQAQIYIDDSMSVTTAEMRSKCRKLKMDHGLDLVVVDYIQLMQAGGARKVENRQLEVAEISRSLKELAKDMNAPVLALSQLSRQAESSKEDPGLAHLRESGALEQDADVVLLLHRPRSKGEDEEGDTNEESWKDSSIGEPVIVNVAKHRNGPTGAVNMLFIKQYTKFVNNAQNWVAEAHVPPPPPSPADFDPGEVF